MHEQDVLIGSWFRFQKVVGFGDPARQQAFADFPVFLCREDMLADRQIVAVAVDQLEGKHATLSIQHLARPLLKDFI